MCVLQVYDMMLRDERYYPSFKQSPLYVRMLAELDMLKEPSYRGSDDGDGGVCVCVSYVCVYVCLICLLLRVAVAHVLGD